MNTVYFQQGYRSGVWNHKAPIMIPRRQAELKIPSIAPSSPPNGIGSNQVSKLSKALFGDHRLTTVHRFDPTIVGDLIYTEGISDSKVAGIWNEDNTQGDTTLKANLSPIIRDFAVDGQLGAITNPTRGNGIHVKAKGPQIENLLLFNIAGPSLVIDGYQIFGINNAGWSSIYDQTITYAKNITSFYCQNGPQINDGDVQLEDIDSIGAGPGYGLQVNGSGTIIKGSHIFGHNIAADIANITFATEAYWEAAEIGLYVRNQAHGSRFQGIFTGPGTCFGYNIKCECNGVIFDNITGTVAPPTAAHPSSIGLDLLNGSVHCFATNLAFFLVRNNTSSDTANYLKGGTAIRAGGYGHKISWRGGWNEVMSAAKGFEASGNLQGCDWDVTGTFQGGTVFDLTNAVNLATTSVADGHGAPITGQGNRAIIRWQGTPQYPIKFPGGGIVYNLTPENEVIVRGKKMLTGQFLDSNYDIQGP